MEFYQNMIKKVGMTRFIITAMLVGLLGIAMFYSLPIPALLNDSLVRFGMYGIFVLSMVPMIICGCGLNFAMPIGIIGGLLGGLVSIEMGATGFKGLMIAILVGIPISAGIGYAYGLLLNKVKGSEMIIATYVGFSAVSLMCIGWLFLPFHSPLAVWPIGRGLRTTITLTGLYDKVLDSIGFTFMGVYFPMGLILFFGFFCVLMWLFLRSRMGIAMRAVGTNPASRFPQASMSIRCASSPRCCPQCWPPSASSRTLRASASISCTGHRCTWHFRPSQPSSSAAPPPGMPVSPTLLSEPCCSRGF